MGPDTPLSLVQCLLKIWRTPVSALIPFGPSILGSMRCQTLSCMILCTLYRRSIYQTYITMVATSRVFFFIRDHDSSSTEVLIPDMAKLSVGDYNRPTVVRSKSSFFRNYNGRTRTRTKGSLRKRTISREVRAPSVMTHKPRLSELAWWQQASTDMSSDQDDDDRL